MANGYRSYGHGLSGEDAEAAQARVDATMKAMRVDASTNGRGKAGKRRKKARDKKEAERRRQAWRERQANSRGRWDW